MQEAPTFRMRTLVFVILAAGIITATFGVVALTGWILEWPLLASFGADLMPMAPSTAVLFLAYGVVIGLRVRVPLSRGAYGISMVIVWVGAVVALLLFVLACMGVEWPGEHLGFDTGTIRGVPTGHMSPVTALCFLLASVSFLASLSRSVLRPWRTSLASGSAGVLLGTCLIFVLAYLGGTPLFYGGWFIPPAINTVLALAVMGLALLALAGWPGWLFRRELGDDSRTSLAFALIFLLLTAGIITTGYFYYRHYEQKYREEVEHQLSAIADLKVNDLVQYRKERMADASILFENASFSVRVRKFLENPEDADMQGMLRSWIDKYRTYPDYDRICLVDTQGVQHVFAPDTATPIDRGLLDQILGALRVNQVVFLDFHREAGNDPVQLTILVPIFDESDAKRPLGVIVFSMDPRVHLYPFLSHWSTAGRTAETLLVRREGDAVLFLNELKFQTNAALNLRIPLAKTDVLAVKAALGEEGVVEGKGYRGIPAIGDVRAVPGSPWFLITCMDSAEIYTPIRERLWQLVLFVGILIFGAGAFMGFVWRQQATRFYQERYDASETLRASEVRYRRLFESAKDGILILNAETGMVVDVNPFLIELLGLSRESFLEKRIWDLGVFKDIVANEANFVELQHKQYIRYEDKALETSDGRRIDVEFVSNVYLVNHHKVVQCNIRDITDRKRAETALRKSERRLSDILSSTADWVWEVDEKGVYTYTSAKGLELLGDVIGKTPFDFMPPDEAKRVAPIFPEIVQHKAPIKDLENWNIRKNGERICLLTNGVPILDDAGNFKGYRGVDKDITERKQAEEALREANRQLNAALIELKTSQAQMIQQARLGALGQMASGIAHDFNNLLVPLLGFSELLLNDPSILEDPKETHELLTAMHTAARDARNLIRRLREFYHPDETLETEDVSLRTLIKESLSLTEPRWKQQARAQGAVVTIQQEHGELPTVTCNRTQIREVFTNLILNAVDAMPEGGALAIRTQVDPGGVVVTLRDSGIGMSEDVIQHCFEPYFTTKGAKGTGMGLAMAYGVIHRHGGSIGIESEVGKGTTVTIHLPLKPPKSEKAVAAPVHVAATRHLRILVVDDEEWVLSLVARYLKFAGHTVEKAINGQEGIRKCAEGGFDLVITDRAMPDMSGDQVAKAIKKQFPKMPVLMLTGFGEMMKEAGECPAGIDLILSKPMTRDELLQAIEGVMT